MSAAAVAAGTALAGLVSQGFNAYNNYATSKKLMQKQYDLNMRQWNAQNEYNLPVNQMQRLEDAGLNPHLVYGSGGASATASTPSSASQGRYEGGIGVNMLGDLAAYQSILNQRANEHYTNVQATQAELTGKKTRELMQAQIENLGAQAGLTTENAFTQGLVNSVAKAVTGSPTAQEITNKVGSAWDRMWNWVGDRLYDMSGNRTYYQSNTRGSKLNKSRLF
ncbi:DNA pilot protein [Dipodfec virus UOA04_Rod_1143]|nr:DNA pilot protein [Dipodfec virus UOA04_Rod_1143]